ncbi:MAG TPA: carboxypeptidase regulatory-like domain-containing protein [Bryobacteraceae bacterium]
MDVLPLRLKACLLALCSVLALFGQTPPSTTEESPARIDGAVMSKATGQPLRRAQVLLKPVDAGTSAIVQTTDDSGKFVFPKVTPGRYSISVQRDGYLPLQAGSIGAYKMPPFFTVRPGDIIHSFDFRLVPWGVIGGKVKFDDAEPAVNVAVQLYREYYLKGRHGWAVAAATRTNDRGEYRVHGLEPGSYYIAALYQPPARPPNSTEQRRTDASGKPAAELSYAVTFYPEVQKLADAVAVRISPGQEVNGMDIFLTLVHTVRIHGRVTSALSGQVVPGPSITLRWNDADNTGSVSAPVDVSYDSHNNFEIKGVTPGPYLIVTTGADEGTALSGRTPVNVGDSDIEELEIVIGPERKWKGTISVEGDESIKLPGLVVAFEPRRGTAFPSRAQVSRTRDFSVPFLPQEIYDLEVLNAPEDVYLKSVLVGNSDRLLLGLEAQPGADPPPAAVVLSTKGGQVFGKAVTTDSMIVATGASVLLIPDPPYGRSQSYRFAYADEQGNFLVRGVPPGRYVVVAWLDQPPCDVYNPDDLAACKANGVPVTATEGAVQTIQVTAN